MSLDVIVPLTITVDSRAPSQEGFGTPLLLGYHEAWLGDFVREYADHSEMLEDGFTVEDDLYLAARIVKSQEPCPATFKIGRRETPLTQIIELVPTKTTEGFVYKATIGGKVLTYTVLAGASVATISTALATAINTLVTGTTALASATKVTCTSGTPGKVIAFDMGKGFDILDVTVDTTTDNALVEVLAEDDDWYGLSVIDSQSQATALLVAAAMEAVRKICVVQTPDTEATDANVVDDVMSSLKLSSYSRTGAIYHRAIGGNEWLAAGWLAGHLTTEPGSATMAHKEVAGVKKDTLTAGQESAILAKNGSHYTDVGGLGITFEGKAASGEFLDLTRGIDWLFARLRERVIFVKANNKKIPYTDRGVDLMRGEVLSVLMIGVKNDLLKEDPAPTVTAPLVKNIPAITRATRILPDMKFRAEAAGAIHRTIIDGTIAV